MIDLKVLQTIAGAEKGGAEAFFTRLVPALAHAGLEQQAVIRENAERAAALREAEIPVEEVPFGGKFDLVSKPKLKSVARSFEPDVIFAWMNLASKSVPKGPWTIAARLSGYNKLKNFAHCDHLVGDTPDVRRYLVEEGWPEERAWYLPKFIDDRRMEPLSRASLDTPEDAPLILCLGRLHRNKALDTAIEVLSRIDNAHLWIAGSGPEESDLKELAVHLGVLSRVHFLGWQEELPPLFAAADVFLTPSRQDFYGNTVVEAWAQDVPVVAAESEGPARLIEDGKSGLLVPVDDADALAAAVTRVLGNGDLRAELAGNGRTRFEADHTESSVVAAYLEFFQRIRPG